LADLVQERFTSSSSGKKKQHQSQTFKNHYLPGELRLGEWYRKSDQNGYKSPSLGVHTGVGST
jgi:hypothetical protein